MLLTSALTLYLRYNRRRIRLPKELSITVRSRRVALPLSRISVPKHFSGNGLPSQCGEFHDLSHGITPASRLEMMRSVRSGRYVAC